MRTNQASLAMMFESLRFSGLRIPDLKPQFNICPTQMVLAIRQNESGENQLDPLRWGLVPFWAKELKIGAKMINARSETVATKPAFRAPFKSRRCLVLADGFYEWKKEDDSKQPYFISRVDNQPYLMAGLWESWTDPQPNLFSNIDDDSEASGDYDKGVIETCTILTTEANEFMSTMHDRMPVLMNDPDAIAIWLERSFSDRTALEGFFGTADWSGFQAQPVSRKVNFVRNDGPELIAPIDS